MKTTKDTNPNAENTGCNPQHQCIHEEWRETVNQDIKDLKEDTKDLKNSHMDILLEIKGLRTDLRLTQQQNGYQNKDIECLKTQKEKQENNRFEMKRDTYKLIGAFILGVITPIILFYLKIHA